jgi:hypothetical protein
MSRTMNKKLAKNWAEALESGKYKQTDSVLAIKDSGRTTYCCLGVLCRVAQKMPEFKRFKGLLEKSVKSEDTSSLTEIDISPAPGRRNYRSFRNEIGMSSAQEKKFISLNDDKNASFKEIAKVVRKKYKV